MRTMAMQGLRLHRPEYCLGLAETGLNRAKGRVGAQTEALFRIVQPAGVFGGVEDAEAGTGGQPGLRLLRDVG